MAISLPFPPDIRYLVKAPAGRAGRPSKILPLEQAQELLRAAGGPAPTGTAVFPHPTKDTTPPALRASVKYHGVLHDRVVIVSVISENVP
jgi:KUP system potassium uptake protein